MSDTQPEASHPARAQQEDSQPEDTQPDASRTEERASLLPEELAAGSDDPQAQARAVLEDSDERTEHPEKTKHESVQTPD